MSDTFETDEIVPVEWPTFFTQVPVWLLLAGCTAQAYRMYAFLAEHINNREPGARIACPKQTAIAKVLHLNNPRQVGGYARELAKLGAIRMEEYRYANGMRRGYRYHVRFNPPPGHGGLLSLPQFYEAHPELRPAITRGRFRGAVTDAAATAGGTEYSTSGGTENSTSQHPESGTSEGSENSTPRGPLDSTPHGPADGSSHGPLSSGAHSAPSDMTRGATSGGAHGPEYRSPELDEGELDQGDPYEGDLEPSSSVGTAEDRAGARTGEQQIGAASPRDLSPASAGGTAGASPASGPRRGNDAPMSVEARHVAMARDVVARLPRWIQPGDPVEWTMAADVIAPYIAQGYPVAVLARELSGNEPPEPIGAKPKFILARLRRMAPWVPPARPAADTSAVDEIRERQAQQAGTPPPPAAADARAAMAAARRRGAPSPKQQQETGGGTAGS